MWLFLRRVPQRLVVLTDVAERLCIFVCLQLNYSYENIFQQIV